MGDAGNTFWGVTCLALSLLFFIFYWIDLWYSTDATLRPYKYVHLIDHHGWSGFSSAPYWLPWTLMAPVNLLLGGGFGAGTTALIKFLGSEPTTRGLRVSPNQGLRTAILVVQGVVALVGYAAAVGAVVIPIALPYVLIQYGWHDQFTHSCAEYNIRVWLDWGQNYPSSDIWFEQFTPQSKFLMTMTPSPAVSDDFYNSFALDPGYTPGQQPFWPHSYDTINYNLTAQTYTLVLNRTVLSTHSFTLFPTLSIPDLNITADTTLFGDQEIYEAFLKGYDSSSQNLEVSEGLSWSDNTDVLFRTAKFSQTDALQICARGLNDPFEGLGEMTPVPVGLLMLLRSHRSIINPNDNNDDG